MASVCQQPHQVITVGDEFLSRFPYYAEHSVYLTEGTLDVSRSSDLYVSERAREIAPVKIVGTYGSEILCQLAMFKPEVPAPGLFRSEFLSYIQQASATYAELRREHPVTFAAFHQSPWYHHGVLAIEESQLTVRSPYLDNDFVRTVYRAPKSNNCANGDLRLRLIGDGDPVLLRLRSDRGVGENRDVWGRPPAVSSSSRSKRNTPMTMACPSGSRASITCCPHSISNVFSLAGTN